MASPQLRFRAARRWADDPLEAAVRRALLGLGALAGTVLLLARRRTRSAPAVGAPQPSAAVGDPTADGVTEDEVTEDGPAAHPAPAPTPRRWLPQHVGARLVGFVIVLFFTYEIVFSQSHFPVLGALSPLTALAMPLLWIAAEFVGTRRRARRGDPAQPGPWLHRTAIGEMIIVASIASAFAVQAEYATNPGSVTRPAITVQFSSPDPAAPRPKIYALTGIGSIYRTCATVTTLNLVLPDGANWQAGQTVGVGIDSTSVDGVTADFGPFPEPDMVQPRVVLTTPAEGYPASVFTVPAAPPRLGSRTRTLRIIIDARWGTPRSFGSCTVSLPALLPVPGPDPGPAGHNALVGLRKAGVAPVGAAGPLQQAENRVQVRYEVVRDEAFPPPDVAYDNRWTCNAATASTTPGTRCDSVTPVEDPVANNMRAFLLLLAGTMLAFGVQLVYEHRRHYASPG